MTLFRLISVAALLLSACSSSPRVSNLKIGSGGVVVENGGDFLKCRSVTDSPFAGEYALDYVLTFDSQLGRSQDPRELSFDELTARTTHIIDEKLPELASSWRRYLALLESSDPAQERVWQAVGNSGLADLVDEGISRNIDANCLVESNGRRVPDLKQMVRRSYHVNGGRLKIFYDYDLNAFREARAQNALQLSYLVVHEWLWDFIREPRANRSINHLLHTQAVESMDAEAVRTYLRSMGVSTDEAGEVGRQSGQEVALQHAAAASPFCDVSRRLTVAFSTSGRTTIEPGQSVAMPALLPRMEAGAWPQGVCGVAVVYGRRAVGVRGSQLVMELRRGERKVSRTVSADITSVQQDLMTGFCADRYCDTQSGDLSYFFSLGESVDTSNWVFKASVPASAPAAVDITYPYLVFYASKAP